jgi:hypothetical protein
MNMVQADYETQSLGSKTQEEKYENQCIKTPA